jgi:hypothetical protein
MKFHYLLILCEFQIIISLYGTQKIKKKLKKETTLQLKVEKGYLKIIFGLSSG